MVLPDPEQPRQKFDELEMIELTSSIKGRGIKQPLTVRWNVTAQKYMVIDGGRRHEAARRLKLEALPCWVQHGDRQDILIDQIVHNWQRANLRPYETADALARLRDEFGLTQKDLCRVTGKPKSEISKLLALHDKVDPDVQKLARNDAGGKLTKRHLYNISKLKSDQQRELAAQIQDQNLNALETERLVDSKSPSDKTKRKSIEEGLPARQQRFFTPEADVLITFRSAGFTRADVQHVISYIGTEICDLRGS